MSQTEILHQDQIAARVAMIANIRAKQAKRLAKGHATNLSPEADVSATFATWGIDLPRPQVSWRVSE
jgi:hypothetical protein